MNPKIQVVLISGKQGAGKSSVADALQTELSGRGRPSWRFKFAGPLYSIADQIYDTLDFCGEPQDRKKAAYKHLLQAVGSWGREYVDPLVWTRLAVTSVERSGMLDGTVAVFDDCRFEDELYAFPDAHTVRLVCDEPTRKARTDRWRDNVEHPSEVGMDAVPLHQYNQVFVTDGLGFSVPEIAASIADHLFQKEKQHG